MIISVQAISLKLPDELLAASSELARERGISRAEYIRLALEEANRRATAERKARQMARASRLVRAESARVNAEFAAFEDDPIAEPW